MRYKLLLGFVFILIVGTVIASSGTLGVFQSGKDIELKQTCVINGTFCDRCNISSVDLPNGTIALQNLEMTKRDSDFNFTIANTSLEDLGRYRVNGFCDFGSDVRKTWVYVFDVTATGNILSTGESIIYVIFLVAIIFTFMIALFGAVKIPFRNRKDPLGNIIDTNNMKFLKIFLIAICYALLMFIFGVTRSILANYLFLNGAFKVFNWLFYLMLAFVWPLIVLSFLFTLLLVLDNRKIQNALERGVPIR